MSDPRLTNPAAKPKRSPRRSPRARPDPTPTPPELANIPDKLYFRIGEVARLCGVQASVLRFWETEFPQLRPNKAGSGQRLFRRRDLDTALRIRQLLYAEGYTIAGARQLLRSLPTTSAAPPTRPKRQLTPRQPQLNLSLTETPSPDPSSATAQLLQLRQSLQELHALLSLTPTRPRHRPAPPIQHPSLFDPDPADVH